MEKRVWHEHYVPQVPPRIDYENVTLPEALDRTAQRFPKNTTLAVWG